MTTQHDNDNDTIGRGAEIRRLHDSLREPGAERIPRGSLLAALGESGLREDDPRLQESLRRLAQLDGADGLGLEELAHVVQPNLQVIQRHLSGAAVIPEFGRFTGEIRRIYDETRANDTGTVADYIPQLGRVNPDQYGVALCTIDGQRFALGDAGVGFCIQSCCKPVSYCLALEEHGAERVHRHVGREPSGLSFNELSLNPSGLPHNPMINAGAIMSGALVRPDLPVSQRFELVMDTWRRLAGGTKPGFENSTYLSERGTADRNFALGYFMREHGAFPEGVDLREVLEFYFQCCSIEMTAESMSVVAATLANGGVCPTTGERVLQPDTVRRCLSMMSSCGMYDFSGEWAFVVGLPAKSGVSGAIWVVVPGVMGFCAWSPRLDELGNSVRGIDFFRGLVNTFSFHAFDGAAGVSDKLDPRRAEVAAHSDDVVTLCWAASEGDVTAIRHLVARGVAPHSADYDGRTPMHLAAAEGRTEVVEYLQSLGVPCDPLDRWGGTPLDDARRGDHAEIVVLFEGRDGGAALGRQARDVDAIAG